MTLGKTWISSVRLMASFNRPLAFDSFQEISAKNQGLYIYRRFNPVLKVFCNVINALRTSMVVQLNNRYSWFTADYLFSFLTNSFTTSHIVVSTISYCARRHISQLTDTAIRRSCHRRRCWRIRGEESIMMLRWRSFEAQRYIGPNELQNCVEPLQ